MVVGGWSDLYRNAALRLIEHLDVPEAAADGAVVPHAPDDSIPGPRIDHVRELIRWFDRWLRAPRTASTASRRSSLFVRRSTPPEPDLDAIRGRVAVRARAGRRRAAAGGPRAAGGAPPSDARGARRRRRRPGTSAAPTTRRTGWPLDQRPDEIHSLVYDWPVADGARDPGGPVARADACARAQPVAFAAARLCEVLPDGTSALVSRGILNLTHRGSHADPEPLVPGEPTRCGSSSTRRRGSSPPGTGSGWRSPARTGRTPGRRRRRPSSRSTCALTRLDAPRVAGPAAGRGAARPRARAGPAPGTGGPRRGGSSTTSTAARPVVVGQESQASLDGGDRACSGVGRVRAGRRPPGAGPGLGRVQTDVEVAWPEVTARSVARASQLRATPSATASTCAWTCTENGEPCATRGLARR